MVFIPNGGVNLELSLKVVCRINACVGGAIRILHALGAEFRCYAVFTDDIFNGYSIFVTHSSGFEGWLGCLA